MADGYRPFWQRHQHRWSVVAERFTPPGGEVGSLKVKGGAAAYEALQRHYDLLDRMLYGATTVVYECSCGVRMTDVLAGDARTTPSADAHA